MQECILATQGKQEQSLVQPAARSGAQSADMLSIIVAAAAVLEYLEDEQHIGRTHQQRLLCGQSDLGDEMMESNLGE